MKQLQKKINSEPSIINKPVPGIDASKIIKVSPRMLKENSRKVINEIKI